MDAYEGHLNKVKIPEVTTITDQRSSLTTSSSPVSQSTAASSSGHGGTPSVVHETIQVSRQPAAGEFFVEQVQTAKPDLLPSRSPDLIHNEATISSEDEYELDHANLDHEGKPSKIKKVKNKLGKAFRKVFHMKDKEGPHDEPEKHLHHETGNPDDNANKVKLVKEVDPEGHTKRVQDRLENAFATEGLQATRDANMVSQNRYEMPAVVGEFMEISKQSGQPMDLGKLMDMQDHREPEFEKLEERIRKEDRRGSGQQDNVGGSGSTVVRDTLQQSGYSSISGAGRTNTVTETKTTVKESSPEKVPFSVRRAEMADPILRDLDPAQLAPLRRNSIERTPIHPTGHHGVSEYHERQHIAVHSSPSPDEHPHPPHITRFENINVRSHVGGEGELVRSNEEWNLAQDAPRPRAGTGNSSLPKDVQREGEHFSDKYTTSTQHHGSTGDSGKRGSIGAGVRVASPITRGFEDRSHLLQEKQLAPGGGLSGDRSDFGLAQLDTRVDSRPFERVASDVTFRTHEPYTRLPATMYSVGTYADRSSITRTSVEPQLEPLGLTPKMMSETQADSMSRQPIRNDSYLASMDRVTEAGGDARIASHVVNPPSASYPPKVSEMKRGEEFLDAELSGEDLTRPKHEITVHSTIPENLEQPILEVYDKPNDTPMSAPSAETMSATSTLVRETDRVKDVPGGVDDLAGLDEEELKETEDENKGIMTKMMEMGGSAVESAGHAISDAIGSVTAMFTHKTEEEPAKQPEVGRENQVEEHKGVLDYVAEKVFSLYTAGTGTAEETPSVEEKPPLASEIEKSSDSPTNVVPLAVKGEFCEGPIGGVATLPVEADRSSGLSAQSNIALGQARRES